MADARCKCDPRFTCGFCLANAKPWHYTLSNGSALYPPPVDVGSHSMTAAKNATAMTKLTLQDPGLAPLVVEVEGDVLTYLNTQHSTGYTVASTPKGGVWSRTINCQTWGEGTISQRVWTGLRARGVTPTRVFSCQELEYDGLDIEGMIDAVRGK